MPYPRLYLPMTDFALTEQEGAAVDGTKLAAELAAIGLSLNQLRDFIKAGFTSDKRWMPQEALAQELVEQFRFTATAGQTDFLFDPGITATPPEDKARVFVNGLLLDPATVTLLTDRVTIPAQLASALVVVELFNDSANLRSDLASTVVDLGASLVGVEDAYGLFTGKDVETVLIELGLRLVALIASLGDLSLYIKADGSVEWQANQGMGGHKFTGAAPGLAAGEFVTYEQLQALSAIYGDLAAIYLPKAGGTMSGPINMGNNIIVALANGTQPAHAINLGQLNSAISTLSGTFLPLSGGTMTGAIAMGGQALTGLPDATLPTGATPLSQVQALIAGGVVVEQRIGATGADGDLTDLAGLETPVFANNLTIAGSATCLSGTIVFVKGDVTISGTLTVGYNLSTSARDAPSGVPFLDAGGGGGGYGDGGTGNPPVIPGGSGWRVAKTANLWRNAWRYPGGQGAIDSGPIALGGGALVLVVDGNLTLTGSVLAEGQDSIDWDNGGGGGGSIVLIVRGALIGAGGTISVQGGDGQGDAGSGGGGYVAILASSIVSPPTVNVTAGPAGRYLGQVGLFEQVTSLTQSELAQIVRMMGL